jgi:hypothetical protein
MKLALGILLLFLALNMLMGLGRKLKGGTFLPSPGPDDDHHLMDRNGRWWRQDPKSGTLEEAFRRPSGAPFITPFLWNAIFSHLKFVGFVFTALLILGVVFWTLS